MRELNLRCIDLNLLVALNALLEEKHVTNAALKLNMTQSSMSRALGRIRETFGDQILVRMPDGYEITPHAENLVDPVKRIFKRCSAHHGSAGV